MSITPPQIGFLIANVLMGALVGYLQARVPQFASLPVPQFGWLVLGVLILDLATGYLAGAHPTAVISMPLRVAALALAFLASFVVALQLGTAPAA